MSKETNFFLRIRDLFECHVDAELLENLRVSIIYGFVLGDSRFETEIENLSGRRITANKVFRPIGRRKLNSLKI
jgi:hypothetical protein